MPILRLYIYRCGATNVCALTGEKGNSRLPAPLAPDRWQFWMQTSCNPTEDGLHGFAMEAAVTQIAARGYYLFCADRALDKGEILPRKGQAKEGLEGDSTGELDGPSASLGTKAQEASMRIGILPLVVVATVLASCQSDRQPTAAGTAYPDLSSPCRFQPSVGSFAGSPAAIKVGEDASLTAEVLSAQSWTLSVAPGSLGDGTLTPKSGTGALRARFVAHQPGEAVILASGDNPECGFSTVVRTTITVLP